jgi:MerR family transcriptional regulator, light-induced transcriptional regulator
VIEGDDELVPRCSAYLEAILQGDRRAAVAVALEALEGRHAVQVYRGIVERAQVEVGALWARNEITVAREHMATAVSQFVLGELYARLPKSELERGRAVVTGVEGEYHQLGANMVADLLETDGWSVRFLGTQLPHGDVVAAVEEEGAGAVGISATMLSSVESVATLVDALRTARGDDLVIVVGGRAFSSSPELWREVGANGYAGNLEDALEVFRRLAPQDSAQGSR